MVPGFQIYTLQVLEKKATLVYLDGDGTGQGLVQLEH